MFIEVEKYVVEVRRNAHVQAVIRLQGRAPGFFDAESRPYTVYLRFNEWSDYLRQEMDGFRDPDETRDMYPGEGFVKITPEMYVRDNELGVDLPLRDFERMYHLLQTESPVYAHWDPDSNEELRDTVRQRGRWVFSLTTLPEPVGEGPKDES